MALRQNHLRPWLLAGGNPNHSPIIVKAKKDAPVDIELVRYVLDDSYKHQSEEIDEKNENLIKLFNVIADARCEAKDMMNSNASKRKLAFSLQKELLKEKAGVLSSDS